MVLTSKIPEFLWVIQKDQDLYVMCQYFTLALSTLRVACWPFFFGGKRQASNNQKSCLAQRLKGIKQKKLIIIPWISMRLLLFYCLQPQSQVWILVTLNWPRHFNCFSLNSINNNNYYYDCYYSYKTYQLSQAFLQK